MVYTKGEMDTPTLPGKKVRDISELLDIFQAQEGIIEHIIGKTGNGKTYYATKRVWELLLQGNVVYTTWKMILPDVYDQRMDLETVFWKTIFGKKQFYKYDLRENWKWIDIDRPDLKEYIASLTDCYVFLDEGQDIFSSHDRIDGQARRTITRTRHMRKTLVIVSQRAQAVDTNARANVSHYYKCVKQVAWFWPFKPFFRVYTTEEMDDANIPVWEEHIPYSNGKVWRAPIHTQYFADKKIYNLYNSWYLRDGIEKSQEVNFEAYELSLREKIQTMGLLIAKNRKKRVNKPRKEVSPALVKISTARAIDRKRMVQSKHEAKETSEVQEDSPRKDRGRVGKEHRGRGKEVRPRARRARREDTLVSHEKAPLPRRKRNEPIAHADAQEHRIVFDIVPKQAARVVGVRPQTFEERYREKLGAGRD